MLQNQALQEGKKKGIKFKNLVKKQR